MRGDVKLRVQDHSLDRSLDCKIPPISLEQRLAVEGEELTCPPLVAVGLDRRQQVDLALGLELLRLAQPRMSERLVGRHPLGRVDRQTSVHEVAGDRRHSLPVLDRLETPACDKSRDDCVGQDGSYSPQTCSRRE